MDGNQGTEASVRRRRYYAADYREQFEANESLRGLSEEERQAAVDAIAGSTYIDVTTDFGFKRMFRGHKEFLLMLLRDVLGRDIVDLEYVDAEPPVQGVDSRRVEFDVRCKLSDGTEMDVEMQKEDRRGTKSRFVYYGARLLDSQLGRGEGYAGLKPVKVVCVLNYEYEHPGASPDKLVFEYSLMESETRERYGEELSVYLLELPRLRRPGTELRGPVEEWFHIIRNLSKFAERPAGIGHRFDGFLEAARTEILTDKDMDDYIKYKLSEEERRDIADAYFERGLRKGRETGLQEGLSQGIRQGKLETARQMLGMKMEAGLISVITGLAEEEIRGL